MEHCGVSAYVEARDAQIIRSDGVGPSAPDFLHSGRTAGCARPLFLPIANGAPDEREDGWLPSPTVAGFGDQRLRPSDPYTGASCVHNLDVTLEDLQRPTPPS